MSMILILCMMAYVGLIATCMLILMFGIVSRLTAIREEVEYNNFEDDLSPS